MTFSKKKLTIDFPTLIQEHTEHMYRLAYRFTNCPHDAQNLIQDVLIKIYSRQSEWNEHNNLSVWLATVIYHSFIDRWRHKHYTAMQALDDSKTDNKNNNFIDYLLTNEPNPEQHLELNQRHKRLRGALSSLTEEHRLLIILHDMEGYILPELQSILDTPLGTLKSRLHRARTKLRKILNEKTCHLVEVVTN